jgi:hypothetical protein
VEGTQLDAPPPPQILPMTGLEALQENARRLQAFILQDKRRRDEERRAHETQLHKQMLPKLEAEGAPDTPPNARPDRVDVPPTGASCGPGGDQGRPADESVVLERHFDAGRVADYWSESTAAKASLATAPGETQLVGAKARQAAKASPAPDSGNIFAAPAKMTDPGPETEHATSDLADKRGSGGLGVWLAEARRGDQGWGCHQGKRWLI